MRTLGNIIWHIPFLGFLFSLTYALGGLFFCITIIGIPIGLGWLQFSLFLLFPFSKAMVSREDLNLLTGESQSGGMQAFSTIVRILYFPFGLFAAIGALCTIIGEFISIIGIPCGIVWAKSLSAIFNPVNKVCVPRAVAMEIEKRKEAGTLEKYTSQNTDSADKQTAVANEYIKKAQAKSDDELKDILRQKDDYNPKLVNAAEKVLHARMTGTEIVEEYQPTTFTYNSTLDFTKLRGEVLIMIGMLLPEVIMFILNLLLNIYTKIFNTSFPLFSSGTITIFTCIIGVILAFKGLWKIKEESEYKNIIGMVLILMSTYLNLIGHIRMSIQYNYYNSLGTPIYVEYLLCGLYSFSLLTGVILWKYLNKNIKLDSMGMLLICSATIIDFVYLLFYQNIYSYITEGEFDYSSSMLYLNYTKTILYIFLSIYGWCKFIGLDTKSIINRKELLTHKQKRTMETKQIIGVILLVLGIGVVLYSINVQNSMQYQLASAFGSSDTSIPITIAGGVIAGIIGLVMVLTGKSNKSE